MQQSKDFLEREIQKLTILLAALLGKRSQMEEAEVSVQEIDELLKKEFDLTVKEMLETEDEELEVKLKSFHPGHIEKLSEIMYQISKNAETRAQFSEFDRNKLLSKALLLLNYEDRNSAMFSFTRMKFKKDLEQWLENQ